MTNILQQTIKTPKQLYKYLLRTCDKLPKGPKEHYKHAIKQSFKQHVFEPDPERVKQIMEKSLADAEWIFKKVNIQYNSNAEKQKEIILALSKVENARTIINMDFHPIIDTDIIEPVDKFWSSIKIWLKNPHFINKRIFSSEIIFAGILKNPEIESVTERISSIKDISHLFTNNDCFNSSEIIDDLSMKLLPENIDFLEDNNTDAKAIYLVVTRLFPKDDKNFCSTVEFMIIDKGRNNIICQSKSLNNSQRSLSLFWPYKISWNEQKLILAVATLKSNFDHPSIDWLKKKFFVSLTKWIKSDIQKNNSLVQGSLNLIPIKKYYSLYKKLKIKYGDDLIKNWTECTDPKKFIFEDIAIATYLIILWEQEKDESNFKRKQSFVDLGCGNGLLAYILTNEGYRGLGIDLRRRKIWDLFSQTTQLETRTIIPSSKSLFPNADWIIGNHSDELTPWIPVIAARSSYKCRFFLLPCCAYEFDGKKYQRKSATNSQYLEYLKYVENICEECGFITKVDKLRIPSTKRTCLIGLKRKYDETKMNIIDHQIDEIVASCPTKIEQKKIDENIEEKWLQNFKPREIIEKVRNCTKIDKHIINKIINLVANYLLREVCLIELENSNTKWNAGGEINLCELAKIIPSDTLKQLKKECGGLQTILKNHSHIFQVNNGTVQFKIPGSQSITNHKRRKKSNILYQVKPCWFFMNHPNGCPLSSEKCNFKH